MSTSQFDEIRIQVPDDKGEVTEAEVHRLIVERVLSSFYDPNSGAMTVREFRTQVLSEVSEALRRLGYTGRFSLACSGKPFVFLP